MDMLWQRSAIRFVHQVKTPVMLSHGDNDLLVNPVDIEMYFIALRDVGVETQMLRYPREGHGMRETQHVADFLDRSMASLHDHFQGFGKDDELIGGAPAHGSSPREFFVLFAAIVFFVASS